MIFALAAIALLLIVADFLVWEEGAGCAVGFCLLLLLSVISLGSYVSNADDLGVISAQDRVIDVYQKNIGELEKRLNDLHPSQSALLNADSPVSSLVEAISDVNNKLVSSQSKKAEAYVSIEQRRNGPFWFIVK